LFHPEIKSFVTSLESSCESCNPSKHPLPACRQRAPQLFRRVNDQGDARPCIVKFVSLLSFPLLVAGMASDRARWWQFAIRDRIANSQPVKTPWNGTIHRNNDFIIFQNKIKHSVTGSVVLQQPRYSSYQLRQCTLPERSCHHYSRRSKSVENLCSRCCREHRTQLRNLILSRTPRCRCRVCHHSRR